jgi:Methyltransferase domain
MVNDSVPHIKKIVACKCCGCPSEYFSKAKVLKYEARYYRCSQCLSVQVENPTWIAESHSRAISALDTGLVSRCISASKLISVLLFLEKKQESIGIDWGGGTGLLTRLMRDLGFQMRSFDLYADGYLAEGFQASLKDFEVATTYVTSIECFEHLEDPIANYKIATKNTEYFFFTTELIPDSTPDPANSNWWYFLPETGQHITFLSRTGLDRFREILGFDHYMRVGALHIFSRKPIKHITRVMMGNRVLRKFVLIIMPIYLAQKYSLLQHDKEALRLKIL